MEQVAEALKQLKTDELWKAEVISIIADIVEETGGEVDDDQVLHVFNAIISIYG